MHARSCEQHAHCGSMHDRARVHTATVERMFIFVVRTLQTEQADLVPHRKTGKKSCTLNRSLRPTQQAEIRASDTFTCRNLLVLIEPCGCARPNSEASGFFQRNRRCARVREKDRNVPPVHVHGPTRAIRKENALRHSFYKRAR
jgi:hypothetical protein